MFVVVDDEEWVDGKNGVHLVGGWLLCSCVVEEEQDLGAALDELAELGVCEVPPRLVDAPGRWVEHALRAELHGHVAGRQAEQLALRRKPCCLFCLNHIASHHTTVEGG